MNKGGTDELSIARSRHFCGGNDQRSGFEPYAGFSNMIIAIFILISLLVLGLFALAVVHYLKLKQFFMEKGVESPRGHTFVDMLFHDRLKHEPVARQLQKRVIGLFCASLLMVHVAMLFYGTISH